MKVLSVVCGLVLGVGGMAWPVSGQDSAKANVALSSLGATASSNGDWDRPPSNLIDGSAESVWWGRSSGGTMIVTINLDKPYSVHGIEIIERVDSYILDGVLEVHDGTNWLPLEPISKAGPSYQTTFQSRSVTAVRLSIHSVAAPGGWINRAATIETLAVYAGDFHVTRPPSPQQVPKGGTAVFSVAVTPAEGARFQWLFNDKPISGETNASLVLAGVSKFFEGEYQVRVTWDLASTTTPPVRLSVLDFAAAIFAQAVEVEFPSQLGRRYQVEGSIDLTQWSPIGDSLEGTGQIMQRLYSTRPQSYRFYRVREIAP